MFSISAIFNQDGNENDLKELLMFVYKKSANMSKFSLIILLTVSECWEALFLSNLSMSFFMSSMLSSEKRLLFFTIALYCKYVWVIFVFINYFKSSIYYVFCSRIKLTVSQNIQILITNFIFFGSISQKITAKS